MQIHWLFVIFSVPKPLGFHDVLRRFSENVCFCFVARRRSDRSEKVVGRQKKLPELPKSIVATNKNVRRVVLFFIRQRFLIGRMVVARKVKIQNQDHYYFCTVGLGV